MSAEIASNRRAFHNYQILEKIEAGIELQGTEVKSIRAGFANLNNAFARVENNEVYLYDADIQPYARASHTQHEPKRRRKLLLHKSEITKLFSASAVGGQTLVALRLYWKKQPGKGRNRCWTRKVHHRQTARPQREGCQKRNRSRHVCI
jgi:SsrA-binding protein